MAFLYLFSFIFLLYFLGVSASFQAVLCLHIAASEENQGCLLFRTQMPRVL